MRLKLTNSFHNTSCVVNAGRLSSKTARRVRRTLCPSADCQCAQTSLGTRGSQRTEDGHEIVIDDCGENPVVFVEYPNDDWRDDAMQAAIANSAIPLPDDEQPWRELSACTVHAKRGTARRIGSLPAAIATGSADIGQAELTDGTVVYVTWGRNLTKRQQEHFRKHTAFVPIWLGAMDGSAELILRTEDVERLLRNAATNRIR